MIELLQSNPGVLAGAAALLGLCVGSFLNVVAHRLPMMMEREFGDACREQFGVPEADENPRVSLTSPPSTCPHCHSRIAARHNLPVIGWLTASRLGVPM